MKAKVLFKSRALILEDDTDAITSRRERRCLVVGDLHIGFEDKFQSAGVRLSSNQGAMLEEILGLISENQISDLVVNGDVKSGTDRILGSEWENVPKFFTRLVQEVRVHIVTGNHDGGLSYLLPTGIDLIDSNGFFISDTLILHGHTRPLPKFSSCRRLIMGHVHPIFQQSGSPLSGQPVWIFLKVRRSSIFPDVITEDSMLDVILMPSFNLDLVVSGFSADTAREERRVAPLVRELRTASEAVVTTLDGEVIGDASFLERTL